MRLLVIRPQPGADATAQRARLAGFDPVVLPFFEIRPQPWVPPARGRHDALLVSSANSVRHAGAGLEALKHLPTHVVGRNSADMALKAGLALASTGAEGVDAALANAARAGHRRLLWLAGEDRTALQLPPGVAVDTVIVYASVATAIGERERAAIAGCGFVALHSARAARAFAEYVQNNGLGKGQFNLVAFSPAIADAAGPGWHATAVADSPNDAALLSAAKAIGTADASNDLEKSA